MTDFHAKYIAHELTRRCASDSVEKLTAVLSDAQGKSELLTAMSAKNGVWFDTEMDKPPPSAADNL